MLLRVYRGRLQRVSAFSENCALDVSPLPFVWLDDVRGPDSAAFLGSLLSTPDASARDSGPDPERSLIDGSLLALSLHAPEDALRSELMFSTAISV